MQWMMQFRSEKYLSQFINVVVTSLWYVCIFGAACSGRRTAPWLQRMRIYQMASRNKCSRHGCLYSGGQIWARIVTQ